MKSKTRMSNSSAALRTATLIIAALFTTALTAQNTNLATVPALERRVSLVAWDMPFKNVVAEVCRQAQIEFELDADGLKLAGVAAEQPVSVSLSNEPLDSALGTILHALDPQTLRGIYREMRGSKLVITSLAAKQARTVRELPDWLKPLYNHGFSVETDEEHNVVTLYASAETDDEFLTRLKTLPKLRKLDIEATKRVTPAGLAHLAELPALEDLFLYEVNAEAGLGDEALRVAAKIKTLRELGVAECEATDDGAKALEGMTYLKALRLSGNRLTDAAMKSLAGLTNLQRLDIGGSLWVRSKMQITDKGIHELSRLTELREFSVGNLTVSGEGIVFPHLERLALGGAQVTDDALDSIVRCSNLRSLSLSYTSVSDEGLQRIASLKELRQLNLDSRVITDAGIAWLTNLPKLEHVELRATDVSDEALRYLSRIKSLTRLDLNDSGRTGVSPGQLFTIDGVLQLKDLPELRELWLNNFQSPTGFLALRELKQLRSLVLNFGNVKDAESDLLEAAMPDTRVIAMSGGGFRVAPPLDAKRPLLPSASLSVSGRVVDDVIEEPVKGCTLEFGTVIPEKPGHIVWGHPTSVWPVEVSANDPRDSSRFWGESFRTGQVWMRVLAAGYQPMLLMTNPVAAPFRATNLVVRMRPGGELRGMVVNYDGEPVSDMNVFLADKDYLSFRNGRGSWTERANSTVADDRGRFALPGGNGTEQRLVVVSDDGHMFQVAPKVGPGQEARITLPRPANLVLRYDIPEDDPTAEFFINFEPPRTNLDDYKSVNFGFDATVNIGGSVVLTNIAPGTYRVARKKWFHVGGSGRSRPGRGAWFEEQRVLEPGQTQRVDMVRTTGHPIRGEVSGINDAGAAGAYIYVYSSHPTNNLEMVVHTGKPFDMQACDVDGVFKTARLEPGTYTIVALAFKQQTSRVGMVSHSGDPEFMGAANVVVTPDKEPPPLKFELVPWATGRNRPAAPNTPGGENGRPGNL